jgi:hypothetical protein
VCGDGAAGQRELRHDAEQHHHGAAHGHAGLESIHNGARHRLRGEVVIE